MLLVATASLTASAGTGVDTAPGLAARARDEPVDVVPDAVGVPLSSFPISLDGVDARESPSLLPVAPSGFFGLPAAAERSVESDMVKLKGGPPQTNYVTKFN